MTRPRVAITPWLRELPTALGERTRLYTLDPAYAERVRGAGGVPLLIPRETPPEEALREVDGLLLSGGGDVAPATYGDADQGACEDVDLAADAWELELIALARRERLPTLGICRGMQLLAVAHGGALAQCSPHPGMDADSLTRRHEVEVAPGSVTARLFGTSRLSVNTIHHQVVRDPGSLTVSARAADGTIEALEAPDWPALGVQWHPEKMPEPEQARVFAFLSAAA
jgi:putative glutamine amidotransferase